MIDAISRGSGLVRQVAEEGVMNLVYVGLEAFVERVVGYRK